MDFPISTILFYAGVVVGALVGLLFVKAVLKLRTVVSTNDVHIVQTGKRTTSYGKDKPAGNVYYAWPEWLPIIGCKVIPLPVSVFNINLDSYAAYDKGRVPFLVDIMAFFRIDNSDTAAQRVSSFKELEQQLEGILQGATRSILAKSEIEEILEERAKFGQMFTDAVVEQLKAWGVTNVKSIELMDVRDASGSKVIENIMAKKKSLIEMQSRVEVAENHRKAQEAEIEAARSVEFRKQEAQQSVGIRTAEKDQQVGIAAEKAAQEVKAQEAITAEREMDVKRVQDVRAADIARNVQVVKAEQDRQTVTIIAEGEKAKTEIVAQGHLTQAQLNAKGIEAEGHAKGAAEQALLMAPVNSQITLAKEIGENVGYQQYLVTIRQVEKDEAVGKANAEALKQAEIKVIANTANSGGAGLGTSLGAALEGLVQSPMGKALMDKLVAPK